MRRIVVTGLGMVSPAGLWHRTGLVAAAGGAIGAASIAGLGDVASGARRGDGA